MYNVLTFLENSSLNYPDKTAVKDNNSEITYKELVINAKRIGTFLSEYDVRRKPVVVYGNKSVRVLTTFFGIVYAGGFYVLIDPSFPKERVMKIFNVLKPSVVITDEDKFNRIRECEYKGTVLDINSVEKDIDEAFDRAAANVNRPTVIEFMISCELDVYPMVPGGKALTDMLFG